MNEFLTHLQAFQSDDTNELFSNMCEWSWENCKNQKFYGYILSESDCYRFIMYCEHNYTKFRERGRPSFHVMKESPMPMLNSFKVPRGSIYWSKLYDTVMQTLEYGFMKRWHSFNDDITTRMMLRKRQRNNDGHKSIRLEHMHSAFSILIIGLCFSLIVFLWEIIQFKSNKPQRVHTFQHNLIKGRKPLNSFKFRN